ncbi:MAG: restriction endonuclease subunit S [Smithella sp.]
MIKSHESLPANWDWVKVGDLLKFEYGKALTKGNREVGGEFPVYGSNGIVGYHSKSFVDEPCLIIGRKGAAGAVHITKTPCWPIDTTYYVIPPENLNLAFLYYLLSALNLSKLDRSTAIPGLNREDAYSLEIPVPPYPEQERIVARIEELFSQLDAGTAALKRAKAQLKRYKASVLKAAVEGKLVPQDPNDEPLFLVLQKAGIKPVNDAVMPVLPSGWCYSNFKDLVDGSQNGFGKRNSENGVPTIVLRLADIASGNISLESVRRIKVTSTEISPFLLQENDLLVIRVNGSLNNVGRFIKVYYHHEPIAFCDHFIRYRLKYSEMAAFIQITFNSEGARKYIEENRVSSAGQNTISQASLGRYLIALPPIDEQRRILEEFNRKMSIVHEIEGALSTEYERSQNLKRSILKKAFEGKLI